MLYGSFEGVDIVRVPNMGDQHACVVGTDSADSGSLNLEGVSISPRLRRSRVIEIHSKPSWSPLPVLAQQAWDYQIQTKNCQQKDAQMTLGPHFDVPRSPTNISQI